MLVKNDPGRRWINGTLGKVVEMRGDSIRVRSLDSGLTFDIGRAKWENLRVTYDEQRKRIVSEIIGEYKQFPIVLDGRQRSTKCRARLWNMCSLT